MTETDPRIFISYSRRDGADFAADLRAELEAAGFTLWHDVIQMEGGRDWWQQITHALDHVEYMILVATPAALQSKVVRKEWRYARQQGACVYPVMLPDKSLHPDFGTMPRWMKKAHFYDYGVPEQRRKLLADLQGSCDAPRQPFMATDMPDDFVMRSREFEALAGRLVNRAKGEPVAITTALRGAGGYGKTTLACALCHDDDVQDAFSNGVLWVTLGENPGTPISHLTELIRVLKPDAETGFTSIEGARAELATILDGADALLVVDDVWKREHLNPFLHLGDGVAVLVTTRNSDTLPSGTPRIDVDAMQPDEAVELLAARLEDHAKPEHEPRLKTLAARLGEWPLLLKLANGVLCNRVFQLNQTFDRALDYLERAFDKRGIGAFDDTNAEDRNRAAARSLELSFEQLDDATLARFRELAIFPEDVDLPLATVARLWEATAGLDDLDTEDICVRLQGLSLLLRLDLGAGTLRLHDVVREYLRHENKAKLPYWNRTLLDSYGVERWADLPPEEPYLWDYLAYHLVEAEREEALLATVKDAMYLCAKTLARDTVGAEKDLVVAEEHAPEDRELAVLTRHFANAGHLLNRSETMRDALATLHSRLTHIPELATVSTTLHTDLQYPCLTARHQLPDLPHPALIRTLAGHGGGINACAVSPDGRTIVSASSDQTLKVWDAQTGAERLTLTGHTQAVNGCAVSPDGRTIVSASDDQTLKVWDAQTGAERLTLTGHTQAVNGCAVSPDGRTIVSASDDQTLKVWDAQTGAERLTLTGHTAWVNGCAVSPDGRTIVSARDQTLKVWDAQTGAERLTLTGHTAWVLGCAVSPDGRTIVSASSDQTLKVWDAQTGAERLTLTGHTAWVRGCAVSPDGRTIVSASYDQTLKVWDAQTGAERLTLTGHTAWVLGCAVSPDGRTIVSASSDQTLKVWDAQTGAERLTLTGHTAWVRGCAVSPDGRTIVSASYDQTLKVWDAQTGAERLTLTGHTRAVNGCAVSPDGRTIVSASDDQTLKVWDAQTGAERLTLTGRTRAVNGCAVSPDGRTIVSASDDQTLKVWEAATGAERLTLTGHTQAVNGCAVSPDGRTIVSASYDQTLKVWEAATGAERLTLTGHTRAVNGCAVSPDGRTIVSASADQTLKVWDAQTGAERLTLTGHTRAVNGCAVSPDGRTIVSASADQTLKVWEAATGTCLTTLHVDAALWCCAWSPDGETIVAGNNVGGVYFLRWVGV